MSGAVVRAAAAAAALCFSAPAFAGRPLVVDDAPTIDAGSVQVELGLIATLPQNGGRDLTLPTASLSYGVYDVLQLGLAIPRVHADHKGEAPVDGFGDLHLTAKYNFLPGKTYDFSFAFDLKIPTASRSRGLSTGKFDENFLFIATRHFFPAAIDLNLGYFVVGRPRGEGLENRFFGGMAIRYGLSEHWRLVGEAYGLTRPARGEESEANFQVGVKYHLDIPLILDAAVGRSLLSSGNRFQATLGMTWTRKLDF